MTTKNVNPDPTEGLAKAFGQVLRRLRMQKDVSQQELADTSGLGRPFISLLERGLRAPSLRTFLLLAYSIGVPVADFITTIEEALRRRRSL